MALRVDMKTSVRLLLSLLLLVAAIGPVCLLMSPAMAMASDSAPSRDCTTSDAPLAGCPHATATKSTQLANEASQAALAVPVTAAPLLPPTAESTLLQPTLAAPVRPVAHLTPLRL